MTIPTSSRPSKRAKTTLRGDDDYGPGNIVEIEVQNFMTYGYIKSKPGPRLNLVIGPNGTGKSSLVCAICLGLAGEPQLLGRATTIGDFVKRGEESGWTKISLRGNSDADVVVITRKINTRNKTDWLLNDRPVSKKEIQDVVRGFNIQLNNLTQVSLGDCPTHRGALQPHGNSKLPHTHILDIFNLKLVGTAIVECTRFRSRVQDLVGNKFRCMLPTYVSSQFLPQDRVCEFAKLSPIELLEETEKAVGDPELSAQHRTLIVKSEDLKKLQTTVTQLESTLAQSKANGRELEEDGQRLRQRNEFLAKAESLKKKVVWLQYDEKRVDYQARKEAEAVAKTKLRDALTQQQELQAPLLALRSEKQVAEEASKKLLGLKSTSESRLRQIADQESEMGSRARAQLTDIQEVNKREALRQQRIESAQQDVALAEAEYANLPEYQPPKEQIRDIAAKIEYFQMQGLEQKQLRQEKEANIGQLSRSLDQCNRRLQDINSVKSRLLHTLKNAGAHGIFEAYEWVQSQRHQNKFKNEVYGPVLLEVQIPDKSNAAYIENHVPNHIWRSFITLDAEDRDYCAQHLRQHGCPIINQKQVQRGDPPPLTNEMRELGITMRLDQAISGPEVVKEVLCGQAALDYSFIGTSEANLRADEAPRLGVQDLWTPENHYRWQKSRYGGHISTSVGSVRPVRLFSENVDAKEKIDQERRKADYEARIKLEEDEIRNCNTKFREIEEEAAKQHRLREELTNQVRMERRKRQDMINVIEQRKKKLLMYVNEESSASAEAKLRESIKDINLKRYENVIKLKEVMLGAIDKQTKYAAYHLNVIELDSKVKEMEKDLKGQEQACTQLQRDYENRKHATEIARTALQRAMEEAEELASLTPELQAEFSTMPDSVAELLEAVQECVSSAGAVICNNPNVLEEYERRCKQIQSLTDKVEKERASLDQCLKDIETTQTLWLPRLKDLVRKINETFSRNFMDMAVAGEVSLDEHGTDFDKYGIMIKVKFRETAELQVLSAHHQSGGERSVSTILYLVSLQDLTYCPFRVVDEINQGMDPNNERKMFQQLVRAASQPNTPQCFLLTPKLLPDLEYTEACTVLNIMNGPWLDGASQVWSVGESWSYMSQMICSQ